MDPCHVPVSIDDTRQISQRIASYVVRTPLVRSSATRGSGDTGDVDVFLKCENLQRTGSFKLRGAMSALLSYRRCHPAIWELMQRRGVVTCSSGNFAQGMAYATAQLGLEYTVVVPTSIARFKADRILSYNAATRLLRVPYETWRQTMIAASFPTLPGFFVSAESDPYVGLGNATIALEIIEDLPDVDAILVPFGGGHLAYSIASFLQHTRGDVAVYAVEVSTGAPLTASLRAGRPVRVAYRTSFVDGIGSSFVIPWQFERLRGMLAGVLTVTPRDIAIAIAALAAFDDLHPEGAGAAAFAAAIRYAHRHGFRRPCAVVSGGVIDPRTLRRIRKATSPDETIARERLPPLEQGDTG